MVAARPNGTDTCQQDIHPDTLCQITALHGEGDGWVSIWYCDGDPASNDSRLCCYRWQRASDHAHIVDDITSCAERYGDVYMTLTQHNNQQKAATSALPCRWIWLDDISDLSAVQDAALVLETSPGNYQAFFRLSTACDAQTRRDLQRRGRVALGADPASADPVKVVRVAGAYNTKAQQGRLNEHNHQVRLVWANESTVSLHELRARWPAIAEAQPNQTGAVETSNFGAPIDIPSDQIEIALGNIDAHLRRVDTSLSDRSVAHRILDGVDTAPSPSEARYRVTCGLVYIGLLDHEIAALIIHWTKQGKLAFGEKRTMHRLLEDIKRCLSKAIPYVTQRFAGKDQPLIRRATTGSTRRASVSIQRPRVKKGLQRFTPDDYVAWANEAACGDVIVMTVDEIVEALKADGYTVSRSTVERCERALKQRGVLRRERRFARLLDPDAARPASDVYQAPTACADSQPFIISQSALDSPPEPVIISQVTDRRNADPSQPNAVSVLMDDSLETHSPPPMARTTTGDAAHCEAMPAAPAPPAGGSVFLAMPSNERTDTAANALPVPEPTLDQVSTAEAAPPPLDRSAGCAPDARPQTTHAPAGAQAPSTQRRSSGLPRCEWPHAAVPALEDELQRQRAISMSRKAGSNWAIRKSADRAIVELEQLIASRREIGLALMLDSAPPPLVRTEPDCVIIGDAVAIAGGASFCPPGSGISPETLQAALRQASPPDEDAVTESALPAGWSLHCCDHRGQLSRFGIHFLALGPNGERGEAQEYRDWAIRDAWRLARQSSSFGHSLPAQASGMCSGP